MTMPTPTVFPGFGLPLNFDPQPSSSGSEGSPDPRGEGKALFPTALPKGEGSPYDYDDHGDRMPMLTLREIAMLRFMNGVTDKQDWERKVFDESITRKWKDEITEQDSDFSQGMVDYCLEELRYKAEVYKQTGYISLFHGDVVKSDVAIPKDLQEALKAAVAPLENVPEKMRDWHPESDEMVLDLVHPSLFPLVYGLSRIVTNQELDLQTGLTMSGVGEVVPIPGQEETDPMYYSKDRMGAFSRKFQWLPCDVDISGGTPKIRSYVNNLHPEKHFELYEVLERIIDKIIPLWDATLTPLRDFEYNPRVIFHAVDYGDFEKFMAEEGPKKEEGEGYDFYDREWEWMERTKPRFLVHPEPGIFRPGTFEPPVLKNNPVDLKGDYGPRGLQVIVKLANIHLTPEKPEYKGGSWHVEGKKNEHICASAIYYYDSDNISPSYLAFRQASCTEEVHETKDIRGWRYEQNDWVWLNEIYGLQNREPAVQSVGSIETREGRVITFPNILQHQVQSFKLEDPTKPGHRKILAFFLVDPHIRVISTSHVPCQQKEWWMDIMLRDDGPLGKLPPELRLIICNYVDFPLDLNEAKILRKELMAERKKYEITSTAEFESFNIALCEH